MFLFSHLVYSFSIIEYVYYFLFLFFFFITIFFSSHIFLPLQCPMHYESCTGMIDANIAKRVLSKLLYEKFLEFSDRSLYGEGMRCIYCANFVNFPIDGAISMVGCPYCMKRFCMRCKKAWHKYGEQCTLEKFDETLEAWKAASGVFRFIFRTFYLDSFFYLIR